MFKQCRILNKTTNENFYGEIDTVLENVEGYEFVEIPDDGHLYKWVSGEIINYSETEEYINSVKQKKKAEIIKEYADYFIEFDRLCAAKYARGLYTTEQINIERLDLQNKLVQKLSEV